MNKKRLSIIIGPLLFLLCYVLIPEAVFGSMKANAAVGTVLWMAFWWISGAVDYAVTGFVPIVVNAIFQVADMSAVVSNYASETIMLLLGASILTSSWEETGLDRRIAARFLSLIGSNLRKQLAFWYILCFLLSSILPNAVVCAAMTPIAVSMLKYAGIKEIGKSKTGSLLLLTIAYAAGAGGIASPLGGAMNLVAVDYLEQVTGKEFLYTTWVVRFLPIVALLIVSNLIMLIIPVKKSEEIGGSREYFIEQYKSMPKMTREEGLSLGLFLVATALSFTRGIYQSYLPGLKPAYVFIACAVISFFIKKSDKTNLMQWKNVQKKIVWDLIYVFAGGLALGTLINESGAAKAVGSLVAGLNLQGGYWLILAIVAFTILLSDVTSNTATAAVALPIVISITKGIGLNPIPYIYIATIGVNLSYMLPTSIRAVPVGYGLEPKFMLKKGVPITVAMIVLMSLLGFVLYRFWGGFSVA